MANWIEAVVETGRAKTIQINQSILVLRIARQILGKTSSQENQHKGFLDKQNVCMTMDVFFSDKAVGVKQLEKIG